MSLRSRVLSPKFVFKKCEGANADPSTHHPQTEKRLGPLSLRMTATFMLRISDSGH